ncbi:hypothetical protein [Bacteroides congonensis]
MKKNFVRVMLFGALTLTVSTTVTSCKDYDDDIKGLQEQVDKITSTNPVSTEDMKAAVAEATTALETKVKDLKELVDGKVTATDLQTKIEALEKKLADGDKSVADDLTKAKNELKTLIDGKATQSSVDAINRDITTLKQMQTTLQSLIDAENAYNASGDLSGFNNTSFDKFVNQSIKNALADEGNDKGAIAAYVIKAVQDGVASNGKALNDHILSLGITDVKDLTDFVDKIYNEIFKDGGEIKNKLDDLDELLNAINAYVGSGQGQLADYAAVINEIMATRDAVTALGLPEDKSLKEAVQDIIDTELGDAKTTLGKLQSDLKAEIAALKGMIQSVVYIPEYEDGKVLFMSYYYGATEATRKLVAQTEPIKVKFRISPSSAAAKLVENYTPSFDGQEVKTRAAAEIYHIEKTEVDEETGIVTYTLSTTTDKSYAVSLNLTAKDQTKNLTNINSNYFPIISDYGNITSIDVVSPNSTKSSIFYDNEKSTIKYGEGATLEYTGTDRAGNPVANETIKGVNMDNFKVTYSLKEAEDWESYEISATGELKMKTYGDDATLGGKKVTAKATVTIEGTGLETAPSFETTFEKVTSTASSTPNVSVAPSGIDAINFNGKEDQTFDVDLTSHYSALNVSATEYAAIPAANFTFVADNGVTFKFKDETTKNELIIFVPKGATYKEYAPTVTVKVSETQSFNLNATVKVVNTADLNTYKLNYSATGAATMTLLPQFAPNKEKPSSVGFSYDIVGLLFENYATVKAAAETVGASIKFSLETPITGVSLDANNKLTVSNGYNNVDGAAIKVIAKVVADNNNTIELAASKETTFTLTDLSGTWLAPTATTVKIGSDNLDGTFNLATGASWKDYRGEEMWKDGTESKKGTAWGVDHPLSVYGFSAPTFTVDASNAAYVTVDASGKLTVTESGKYLQSAKNIPVTITPKSQWGTLTPATITVKLDPTTEVADIN